ncbi:MAG: DUF1592 domain-containing protein [Planctomycetia bacterium]|nr:DUF1592 domain-containing protein [Planctomycetia bacterium]
MRCVVIITIACFVACICMAVCLQTGSALEPFSGQADEYQAQIVPLFKQYCISCHGGKKPKGDLNLEAFPNAEAFNTKTELLHALVQNVKHGDMPPANKPQPSMPERDKLTAWLEAALVRSELQGKRDPGRVTMRRLNRNEYNNTIRDLLGVDFKPADDFPADDVGYGFDNIGDVLTLPPLLLEKYLNAAERVADQAMKPVAKPVSGTQRRFQGRELQPRNVGSAFSKNNQFRALNTNAEVHVEFPFPKTGKYTLRVRAFGQQAGNEPPKLDLKLDNKVVKTFNISAVEADKDPRKTYEVEVQVKEGQHKVSLAFTNDFYDPTLKDEKQRDRNLIIVGMMIEGPTDATPVAVLHPVLRTIPAEKVSAREAARRNLHQLAERAFRRPVSTSETDRLMKLFDQASQRGANFEEAHKLPLQAILISPHFLFRVEKDDSTASVRSLNDYELASRLSYFIWSSMPDETLFNLAKQGKLKDPEVLQLQARRMLRDPKALALVENFAGQWLQLRNLQQATPDPKRFPTFDEPLRQAMQKETELFFQELLVRDLPITTFLDADFTFVNERLAKHYGLKEVKGLDFRKVSLKETPRRGILTHASILTMTSNPTRTSPVKRGKWVLETILGTPPPPPPPDVPELKETEELKGTLRQRMEQHRVNPNCATCHQRMDPIGFGFENFDAVGTWRTKDGSDPVDPAGTLPSGQSFKSPQELVVLLKQRDEDFRRCLTEKMVTFAIGRGIVSSDRPHLAEIAQAAQKRGDTLSALIQEIVKSEPFQKRRNIRSGI